MTKKAFCLEGSENEDVRFETDESIIDTVQLSQFCFETTNDATFDKDVESQNTEYLGRFVSEMDLQEMDSEVGEMVNVSEMAHGNDSPSLMLSYKNVQSKFVKMSQTSTPGILECPDVPS